MKYLIMKEVKDNRYRIIRKFDNLTSAMQYAIKEGYFGRGLVVKEIENFEVREK